MSNNACHLFTDSIIEAEPKPGDDAQNDESSSETIKCSEEFENSTDQDIESIMEEMNKLADSLSISSASDGFKLEPFKDSPVQKGKSLEELLVEAEELAKINAYCLSENMLQSDSESNVIESYDLKQFDNSIFDKLEEEIRRDLEKSHNDFVFEENKSYQNQVTQSPHTSNIDNFFRKIATYECSENTEDLDVTKNNLQKELIDVDEYFFDHTLNNPQSETVNMKLDTSNCQRDETPISSKPLQLTLSCQNDGPMQNADISDINNKTGSLEVCSESYKINKLDSTNNLYTVPLTPPLMLTCNGISEQKKELSNEENNLFQLNNFKMLQPTKLNEENNISMNMFNEDLILSKNSEKNENNLTADKECEISESFNFISISPESHKNTLVLDAESNEDKHDKKIFTKKKENRNSISKIKVPLKPRKELFSIKKHNIVLKEKGNEFFIRKSSSELTKNNNKLMHLEKESEELKKLKDSYENDKKELIKNSEHLQQEINNLQQVILPAKINELQRQTNEMKELRKEICKLHIVQSELKEQNLDYLLKYDDIKQQNCLLNDELKMFKEQLIEKNNFIAERLQTLTKTELKLRKEIEDLRVDLNTKNESLKITKLNYEKLERTILPLEKELLELRVKEGNLQEKLEVLKSHVEREKQLSQKLKNQVILDSKKIMDLMRQLREMERSIIKKNPDSVSALLLSTNSEHDKLSLEKIKLLEIRNATLENEIKVKEDAAQQRLSIFRKDFDEMIKKYATQILDLEDKLSSKSVKERENCVDISTQTVCSGETDEQRKNCIDHEKMLTFHSSNESEPTKLIKTESLKLQSKKNDVHLIATICKLKFELSNKNKALSKLTREYQELQKTNRRLQTEREKQLNESRCTSKNVGLSKKMNFSSKAKSSDINCNNSNAVAIQCDYRLQDRSTAPSSKTYDPRQYHENTASNTIKNLTTENNILKEELFKMKKDFMALKNKRLHDLNLLQEEHERELKIVIQKCNLKDEEINRLKSEGKKFIAVRANSFQGSNADMLDYGKKRQQ